MFLFDLHFFKFSVKYNLTSVLLKLLEKIVTMLQSGFEHKWLAELIASCLPHEAPARRAAIMEDVGTAQALLPPLSVWAHQRQALNCKIHIKTGLD